MTTKNLEQLFKPTSVAVIGASNREGSVGARVMTNLLQAGFKGPIMPVNPKSSAVAGVLAYPDVESLPMVPDLGIVLTPAPAVPDVIDQLGQIGTRAAVVVAAGMSGTPSPDAPDKTLQDAMLDKADRYGMRLLGPNCIGMLVPGVGLNASFSHLPAKPGKIAFVSQSGALCTAVLDWAYAHDIGFSHFVSLGDCADVDFGDVIDYLGSDPHTHAILLYIESIHKRRDFMSAGRAAARNKPIIVIKSGRVAEGAQAAASHTGALAGADDVYDAAFKRAGMLRVDDIGEIFAAVETLARARKMKGERLAVLTNGGGIGVLAVDDLIRSGGRMAKLSDETLAKLDEVLPTTWSHGNPVDIIGDAPGSRYADASRILCQAKEVDALLVMHAPTATADSIEAARAVVDVAKETKANVLTNWVGEQAVAPARKVFSEEGIPTYATPSRAVAAFMHMVNYRRNQETLMEMPTSAPEEFKPATAAARLVVENVLANGHRILTEPEAKAVLAAYGIPTVETHVAPDVDGAVSIARRMGFPVAIKILSPDISHKSDVGGVDLHLDSPEAVRGAAENMLARISERIPDAKIHGFSVQQMAIRPGAHELIIGVSTDPIFGPVLLFGQGGTAVEVIGDRAIALPPLNTNLAQDLISRTRISKLLKGYRDRPSVNMDALCLVLMQISQIAVDIPEIVELDINPLLSDENGVLALDARIRVQADTGDQSQRLAIRPYPKNLEEEFQLRGGPKVLLRPIRPEDEPEHHEFISKLSPEDIRFRFFGQVDSLPHSQMARLTQIDYDREMAFIASCNKESGHGHETLGVVRTVTDPNNERAEFAIVVRSDLKGQKLGWKLLDKMINYCRARGTREIVGQVMLQNKRMLELTERMGFKRRNIQDEGVAELTLVL
ncbi:bifunctional acetate--CoA ligase family protein/GNAT family N-acetyltransferase [Magnetospira sp. QH-2]|uniref:bifunctional acetate--CoA ligase family protein/GNAT family N-acetyltransferase n=1 Tax=Magnetospira sp. (strain QH-2) TaxID=1288970 RepID=UPI0003E80B4D|nr:bifunctional acetate--CoA ligase family protein/GNAT family N-acetyltransferase [Magnetospira sp. QH-2]CCQ73434.1 Fused acyl-CoA synthetase: NAD(P)-binding subunit; ATP-binding subunit [Magnetospira sp. QH-2]